jgi:4-hydroxyproline epimerase
LVSRPALAFVDSHTEGEPTRVVYDGLPDLGLASAPLRERAEALLAAGLREAILDAPRGYPALVGALLLPPTPSTPRASPRASAAVVFINNVGLLPMCVHASIGLARTLVHLGRMPASPWDVPLRLETLAGEIEIRQEADHVIAVDNVWAYRLHHGLELQTSRGLVRADVAWGGNWFLIVDDSPVPVVPERLTELSSFAHELRAGIEALGLRGGDGAAIDHVQLCGPSETADSRNFVLCPGGEYDRSACGTGTSARLACLHADGRLAPGRRWRQQGITGSCFIGEITALDSSGSLGSLGSPAMGRVRPCIRGRAWVTAAGVLLFEHEDT